MKKMGYKGKEPIGKNKEGLVEPIHMEFHNPKDRTGLGFREEVYHPTFGDGHVFDRENDYGDEE